MKKAIIKVHGNPTLSRIVQELAGKAGYIWCREASFAPENLDEKGLCFGAWYQGDRKKTIRFSTNPNEERKRASDAAFIDAATEFDKVIAFFEQPQRPEIQVGSHTVEWSDDNKTIKVGCTVVPAETVKAIHDELFKK